MVALVSPSTAGWHCPNMQKIRNSLWKRNIRCCQTFPAIMAAFRLLSSNFLPHRSSTIKILSVVPGTNDQNKIKTKILWKKNINNQISGWQNKFIQTLGRNRGSVHIRVRWRKVQAEIVSWPTIGSTRDGIARVVRDRGSCGRSCVVTDGYPSSGHLAVGWSSAMRRNWSHHHAVRARPAGSRGCAGPSMRQVEEGWRRLYSSDEAG